MSNFWANKIGRPAPQAQPVPPPALAAPPAAPAQGWWARGVPSQAQAVAPVVNQPTPQVPYGSTTTPEGQVSIGVLLGQQDYQTTKPQSTKQTEHCPECGGSNYMAPTGGRSGSPAKRCMECGFNELTGLQSGAGLVAGGGVKVTGPTQPARVQNNAVPEGFAPMGSLIGHA